MRIGVGLPTTTPRTDGAVVLEWARLADGGPFSSVGVLDRVVYDSLEPLVTLAAVAAATNRVRLATMIVIAPLRSTALLAKQTAAIHVLSGGRLTVGLAVGARRDDYDATGTDHRSRGRTFGRQLVELRACWEDGRLAPEALPAGQPEILVGGGSGRSLGRMARYADGFVHGGGPPRAFANAAAQARAAWAHADRPGHPQLWGQGYFALGQEDAGAAYLRDYYAFTGPFAERIAATNLTTARAVKDFLRGYEDAGCDELVLFPTVSDLVQLERLMDVVG